MKKLLLPLLIASYGALAQTVVIKKVELQGEKIVVFYDLEDSNPNNEYLLNLYASKDNFVAPLTKVKGHIGEEIKPGANRKIEWNIKEEYGPYKGMISLEVRGKVHVPFVRLTGFDPEASYKRGKSYSLAWKPGNSNPINIELYKGGQRIGGEMNQPNNGGHTFYIPSHSKPGSDYHLKITDTKSSENILITKDFSVKPKVPLLVKILPVALVGGAAVALGGGAKTDDGSTTDPGGDLPKPPLPGGG